MLMNTTYDVELIKHHTNAGVLHPIGAVLSVSKPDRDWLIQRGIAKKTTPQRPDQTATITTPQEI